MLDKSLSLGTTNLIKKLGDPALITTRYKLDEDVFEGDEQIVLIDSFGLVAGAELTIGPETLVVEEVIGKTVKLKEPVSESYFKGHYFTCSVETRVLGIPRFKRITHDLLEFIRKVRIPENIVVNYGSVITHFSEEFFIVGMDPGDHSVALTLKEINSTVYVYREGGLIPGEESNTWGGQRRYLTIADGEKAYFQYNRSFIPPVRDTSRDPGYSPRGEFQAILSSEIKAKIGDSVIVLGLNELLQKGGDGVVLSDTRYRVVGVNKSTHKNLLTIDLNYDAPK